MLERQPGRVDLLPSIGRAVGQEALLQLLERPHNQRTRRLNSLWAGMIGE
jgi:hypothetical protein